MRHAIFKALQYKNFFPSFWKLSATNLPSSKFRQVFNSPFIFNLQRGEACRTILLQLCCVIFLMVYLSSHVHADEKILIAAASDLNFAMNEICCAFEKTNPSIDVEVTYGSSGNFFAQIKQGAPYDIFFSADSAYPARLEEEGFAVKGQRRPYALGRIVLWIPQKSVLNPQKGLKIILESDMKKLAITNPKHAPYGKAAEEALRYYGLWDKVQSKLVLGENVSQTAQFVQAGAADAGIIALSLAVSPKMADEGNYWIIPSESYNKLEQVYTVLQRGKDKSGAKTFLEFLQGEKGGKYLLIMALFFRNSTQ